MEVAKAGKMGTSITVSTINRKLKIINKYNYIPETYIIFLTNVPSINSIKKSTSSHDGGIGRYTLPPCKTKRRTTTNLKTKNNQNCQKIKPCGSLTTKESKKKHSFRLVGGAETGSQGREDSQQGSDCWSGWSHICMRINGSEQQWSKTDGTTQRSTMGK